MKNLTLENITKACCGTYHGDPSKLDKECFNSSFSIPSRYRELNPGVSII